MWIGYIHIHLLSTGDVLLKNHLELAGCICKQDQSQSRLTHSVPHYGLESILIQENHTRLRTLRPSHEPWNSLSQQQSGLITQLLSALGGGCSGPPRGLRDEFEAAASRLRLQLLLLLRIRGARCKRLQFLGGKTKESFQKLRWIEKKERKEKKTDRRGNYWGQK